MENGSEHGKHKIYKELTLEILAAFPDDQLEDAILNYLFNRFIDDPSSNTHLEIVSNMPISF